MSSLRYLVVILSRLITAKASAYVVQMHHVNYYNSTIIDTRAYLRMD